jgi:hypothetical protein
MIITHRRDVGDGTTIRSVSPLPLHVVNGQLGRLEGHALQESRFPPPAIFQFFRMFSGLKNFFNISIPNYFRRNFGKITGCKRN